MLTFCIAKISHILYICLSLAKTCGRTNMIPNDSKLRFTHTESFSDCPWCVQDIDVFIMFHLVNIGLATTIMISALVFNKVSACV